MLQEGQERYRRPSVGERAGEQKKKRAGRRERQRDAAGVVDFHVPAPELGRDPARETAVGRDQGCRPVRCLQRFAQQERDSRRFLPGAGAIDPADALDRGGPRRTVERGRDGTGGTHGGGKQTGPGGSGGRRIGARPDRDLRRRRAELVEDELEAVLGVACVERVPDRGIRFAVEPRKDDRAPGESGHRRHQSARRRYASRRPGEDHPLLRRGVPP